MKERRLSGGFGYEGVVGVVGILQSWEEVSVPAFPDGYHIPDVSGFHGVVDFLVGPRSLSVSEGIAEGLCGLASVGRVAGSPRSGVGGGALFVPPERSFWVWEAFRFEGAVAGGFYGVFKGLKQEV